MSAQSEKYFDGACTIADARDALQATVRNATWFNEVLPVAEGPKNALLRYSYGCFTT
jgi:hypothetical protein